MSNRTESEIDRLVDEFLQGNPQPKLSDWKSLIDQYPQWADAIADAAMIRAGYRQFQDKQVPSTVTDQVFNASISEVLNLVHQTPSASLLCAKERVEAIQGPSVKAVAEKIGVGPYPSLLNGVLVGRTIAPSRILAALEAHLQVPVAALVELFRRTFAETEVPAYKASGVKPRVPLRPSTWDDAVRAMKLPPRETARLLKLGEQDLL
jgi:hypothetical protein